MTLSHEGWTCPGCTDQWVDGVLAIAICGELDIIDSTAVENPKCDLCVQAFRPPYAFGCSFCNEKFIDHSELYNLGDF